MRNGATRLRQKVDDMLRGEAGGARRGRRQGAWLTGNESEECGAGTLGACERACVRACVRAPRESASTL